MNVKYDKYIESDKYDFLVYKAEKLDKLKDELNSLQDEWNIEIRRCANIKDERECLEELLSISVKELSNKISLKEKEIYRINRSIFDPLLKPKDKHEILEDGMLGLWDYRGHKYLRNNKNQVWSVDNGKWIGVYLPSDDKIDDNESEPDCDEDTSILLLENAIYTYKNIKI
jgi:hypothetical protein